MQGLLKEKEAVLAGQKIAFEPALALVLGQHLHYASRRRQVLIVCNASRVPRPVCHRKHVLPAIGIELVRAEQAKIARFEVAAHDAPKKRAHHAGGLDIDGSWTWNRDGGIPKIRQL